MQAATDNVFQIVRDDDIPCAGCQSKETGGSTMALLVDGLKKNILICWRCHLAQVRSFAEMAEAIAGEVT